MEQTNRVQCRECEYQHIEFKENKTNPNCNTQFITATAVTSTIDQHYIIINQHKTKTQIKWMGCFASFCGYNTVSFKDSWGLFMQVNICCFSAFSSLFILYFFQLQKRLPNSDINVTAFKKMAAIVGAFTRHISEISTTPDNNEFDYIINHIFSCPLRSEHGEQQFN